MVIALLATVLQIGDVDSALAVVDDPIRTAVDVLHYDIRVRIPDQGAMISASTRIRYHLVSDTGSLRLDFDPTLAIDSVVLGQALRVALLRGRDWVRTQDGGLAVRRWGRSGDTLTVTVHYHGEPRDGLFIQQNRYGERTAYADNWPNRARHWFPGVDHPSDKAAAAFHVEVPTGWNVVANGVLETVDSLTDGRTVWSWRERRPIPVYTMVIGGGRQAVTEIGRPMGIPHSVWTFPQDSTFAVSIPFARANMILETLARLLGPFPYEKLAHVESSTRFGGMENSSAIFYTERRYVDRTMGEAVVVHETAHQWFGDAVTELDWHHLWLSEGFATYLTAFFYELIGEEETFRERLRNDKRRYLESDVVDRPVIDTTEKELFRLLNANNYPKGGWILHMLRREVGDSVFVRGLRSFYDTFRDSTVLTSDFVETIERQAGRDLDWFFRQWLLQPGYPQLDVAWSFDSVGSAVELIIRQVQPASWGRFRVLLPIRMVFPDGGSLEVAVPLEGGDVTATYGGLPKKPTSVTMDPNGEVLVEVVRMHEVRQ